MRFNFAEAMTDPKYYIPLAKASDEAGYLAMTIPDSITYPEELDALPARQDPQTGAVRRQRHRQGVTVWRPNTA